MPNFESCQTCVKWAISYICVLQLILQPAVTLRIQPVNQWEMKRTELNYHLYHLHLNCPKLTPVYRTHNTMQQYRICRTQFCLIRVLPFLSIHSIYGAKAPVGTWPPSEDTPIFLNLLLVSSILVFLGSAMCHSWRCSPTLFLVFPLFSAA